MIVGTAGHIDHGKTSLVKALTGIDTDRLQEEKARGITIDLGFAYRPLPSGDILGFVDVPGHEKLIHNMLAGATGIDYVLLAIAADDGPMPQTREHLAILDLLGLTKGVVALTKIDLVDAVRVNAAEDEIRALLCGSGLAGAEIVRVSVISGEGIENLTRNLLEAAGGGLARQASGNFRLAVDRCFTLSGIGTVVTGTVFSGRVQTGDKLTVSPAGLPVRVRSIHAQNRAAERGISGQRCALNLAGAGLEKSDIKRGDWVLAAASHAPSDRFDGRFRLLAGEGRPLRHWTPVHVHIGAVDVGGRIAVLEGETIAPGETSLVQLVLDKPIAALNGDRFVIRDQSAQRTIGGGRIIDPLPPARGRRKEERLAVLQALENDLPAEALRELLAMSTGAGVNLAWFTQIRNLSEEEKELLGQQVDVVRVTEAGKTSSFTPGQWQAYQAHALEAISDGQQRSPDSPGMTLENLRRITPVKLSLPVLSAVVNGLLAERRVARDGPYLHLPGHQIRLSVLEQNLWEKISPRLQEAGKQPPRLPELAQHLRINEEQARQLLRRLARMGKLYQVGEDYFFMPGAIAELALKAQLLAQQHEGKRFTVGQYREATGISRHLSIPLLEFFDRVGFTLRIDDGRRIRRDYSEVFAVQRDEARA